MAHFDDLTPCRYFPIDHQENLVAVGWLDPDFEYSQGDVDPDVVADLCRLLVAPWEPCVTMGWHDCGFCRFTTGPRQFSYNGTEVTLGITNLFVPTDGELYVVPSLILHYIDAHNYSPPPAFCDAVMDCPEMRSMDYLKAIIKNGPKALIADLKTST
ncbi:MAG: hypothetical protein N2C12_06615 [Planctomycetales bacterium]